MGRPPIGKKAMTATERSHRFREKRSATKPATKQSEADAGALAAEIARLRVENARLKAANVDAGEIAALRRRVADAEAALKEAQAQARPAAAPSGGTDYAKAYTTLWTSHARQTDELNAVKKQLADARAAAPGVGPDEEKAAGRLARENAALKEEIAKKDALLANDPSEVGKLVRQHKAARTRADNATRESRVVYKVRDKALDTQRRVIDLAKRAFRKLRAAPHPDGETNRERNAAKTEVAKAINAIMDDTLRDFDRIVSEARRG